MKNTQEVKEKNYERPEIMSLLLKRVNGLKNKYRQNIAVIGQESLGKTSLMFNLLRHCDNNKIIPLYIRVKTKSLENFAKNFMGILLYQFLRTQQQKTEDNLEFLIEASKGKISRTVKSIISLNKSIKESSSRDEIFSQVLELPQILYDETKKPILLIFDEFHNFERFGLSKPYIELSNKIMMQKNTMYIVVSSALHSAMNILNKKLSLLFGNFEVINVTPFTPKISREFIDKELHSLDISCDLKDFLIFLTGGFPFYLDILTEQIKSCCLDHNTETVSEKILIVSLCDTLYKKHGILNQYFNNKYHRLLHINSDNLYPPILLAIARGIKKPSQIGKLIGKKTSDVNRHINKLIEMDIVTKKGVFNVINDPLFVHWLKFVYSPRQNSFNMEMLDSSLNFEQEIKKLMQEFKLESKKKISLRLKELFEMFENDIVELDRKRFMLTHFDQIDIKDINGLCLLNAKRMKKTWVCGIENSFINEAAIGDFLARAKKRECIKKILVAFDGIDANAKLKALEAKVWIWNQDTINDLFSLFEKPGILK